MIGISDLTCLRVVNGKAVPMRQLVNESMDVLGLGPDAGHDDESWRVIECTTPRTVIVIVNALFWNCVDFGVSDCEIRIECVHRWVRLQAGEVRTGQADVYLSGSYVGDAFVREPNT